MGFWGITKEFFSVQKQNSRNDFSKPPLSPLKTGLPKCRLFFRQVTPVQDLKDLLRQTSLKLNTIFQTRNDFNGRELTNNNFQDHEIASTLKETDSKDTYHSSDHPDGEESERGSETTLDDDEHAFVKRWKPITDIPDEAFIQLVRRLNESNNEKSSPACEVEFRTEGSFNHIVLVNDGHTSVVVKVPIVGTENRWQPQHAVIMRSEVHTMIHIKNKLPNFPIAAVLGSDFGFQNEIGAPYIVLEYVEGDSATDLWYAQDEDDEWDIGAADSPDDELEKRRITFLQSLAHHMAQLSHLDFKATGMLHFEDDDLSKLVIGPYVYFCACGMDDDYFVEREYMERPVCNTASEYWNKRVEKLYQGCRRDQSKGSRFIWEQILSAPPFNRSVKRLGDEKESFTLLHDDLDFQNIIVSKSGEVIGIIDWDGVGTVPRCVGHTNVPQFLQRDWQPNYHVPKTATLSPWRTNKYRQIYAEAMVKAFEGDVNSDAKYSEKSGMYGAIHWTLFGDQSTLWIKVEDIIHKIMLEIPEFRRIGIEEFLETVGKGWPEARELLKQEIPKVVRL